MMEGQAPVARPILVVEDDEDTVTALRLLLADEGYRSITAPDVKQALACLAHDDPGLVLLDWSLDDGSGEEVLSAARRAGTQPPVVLMTGHVAVDGCAEPPDAVLHKPFDIGELFRIVARYYRP